MDLSSVARLLIVVGLVLVVAGLVLLVAGRVPGLDRLGRLPGDIVIQRGPATIALPIVTSIVLSILLTVVLNLLFRR